MQFVEAGEAIAVISSNEQIAEIRSVSPQKQLRPFGLCAGEFVVPDKFNTPLSEDVLSTFEGK